jgi:hypothetical protein
MRYVASLLISTSIGFVAWTIYTMLGPVSPCNNNNNNNNNNKQAPLNRGTRVHK